MRNNARAKRADESTERLESLSVLDVRPIDQLQYYKTAEFLTPSDVPLDAFESCEVGFRWQRNRQTTTEERRSASVDVTKGDRLPRSLAVGENVWFRLRFSIPESMAGHPVYLRFVAEPIEDTEMGMGPPHVEALCYRDGEPWQAFDDGHDVLLLTESAAGGEEFDLLVEAGTTTLWGLLDVTEFVLDTAELFATREAVTDLSRNYGLLNDLRTELPEESMNRGRILRALSEASNRFAFDADTEAEYAESAEHALAHLDRVKEGLTSELTGHELTVVGHSHIDLAWLWPWSETVRKSGRSFSNVLKLMEEYPEFTFLQSQPHLYEFVRNRYPSVFEGIEERIEDGSWHPTGALWVESDINLASGEALARQYLLGKRYFREEFDVDPKVTFIPDVFGYSGGLPGIARAADCPYFLTQKMSWNEYNDFPHTAFTWEGIDGSSLLSYFPSADTYNGVMSVEEVRSSVTNDDQNDVLSQGSYLVGWGDGGGGPTREMLEKRRIINDIGSLPDVEFGNLTDFFDDISESSADLPTWSGELYLEKHRGTLTTQARTKRNNRKGEVALREAEVWSSLALALSENDTSGGEVDRFEYPHEDLDHAWRILLFNQFHDVLPGSSVTDVYADADRDYQQLFETTEDVTDAALRGLVDATTESALLGVTNSLSWSHSPVVEVDPDDIPSELEDGVTALTAEDTACPTQRTTDGSHLIRVPDVPALGVTTVELRSASERDQEMEGENALDASDTHLENERLYIDLHEDGTISAYDRRADRQLFDGDGNRLVRYRDQPLEYDAWDVEADLYDVADAVPAPTSVEVIETGPVRATVRQTREFGDSRLVQDISLERESERVDFRTEVDWHEEESFLKVHFPVAVHGTEATYDTHFGHIERDTHENTSWDAARYEEPHQHWVDVSEFEYGVAVLNDCKYGVHVDGTDVSLSLLRAPTYPDPEADRGTHEFHYSVYPHEGDLRESGVIEAGYELNVPSKTVPTTQRVEYAPIEIDGDGVVVESIKRAEDAEDRLVVRLYEAWGRRTEATLSVDFPIEGAMEANLVEDPREDLSVDDGGISLEFGAFDIRTILLDLAH